MATFIEQVRLLMPWLPEPLVQVYVDAWVEYSEDPNLTWAKVRQSSIYDTYFPGNRRRDGTVRMGEAEYVATMAAYETLLTDRGVNPDLFDDRFVDLIEGEVSPNEFATRLSMIDNQVAANPDVLADLQRFYPDWTDRNVFAIALDTRVGDDLLARRISTAEVSAEASKRGFRLDLAAAQRYQRELGGRSGAASFFHEAAVTLPGLSAAAARHGEGVFGLEAFTQASLFADPYEQGRVRRAAAAEASQFSPFANVAGQQGLLTGLRRR